MLEALPVNQASQESLEPQVAEGVEEEAVVVALVVGAEAEVVAEAVECNKVQQWPSDKVNNKASGEALEDMVMPVID